MKGGTGDEGKQIKEEENTQEYQLLDLVDANYRGKGVWMNGIITACHGDGTYEVQYDLPGKPVTKKSRKKKKKPKKKQGGGSSGFLCCGGAKKKAKVGVGSSNPNAENGDNGQ